jgi:hypothetical protein
MIRALGLLPILGCGIAMAAAVTTPITATITTSTFEVGQDGQATLINQTTGTFARASDGRELTVTLDSQTNQPATAVLRASGQDVSIKYPIKQYMVHSEGPLAPYQIPFIPKTGAEAQTINGVYAVAVRNIDGNTGKEIGKAWISPEYKINVRTEFQATMPTGKTIRQVTEMSNIKIGSEPDPSVFVVPEGFTAGAGNTTACKVCGQ